MRIMGGSPTRSTLASSHLARRGVEPLRQPQARGHQRLPPLLADAVHDPLEPQHRQGARLPRRRGPERGRCATTAGRCTTSACGYYPNSTFVHLDVRDTPGFWIDYSRPGEPPRYNAPNVDADEGTSDVGGGSAPRIAARGMRRAPSAPARAARGRRLRPRLRRAAERDAPPAGSVRAAPTRERRSTGVGVPSTGADALRCLRRASVRRDAERRRPALQRLDVVVRTAAGAAATSAASNRNARGFIGAAIAKSVVSSSRARGGDRGARSAQRGVRSRPAVEQRPRAGSRPPRSAWASGASLASVPRATSTRPSGRIPSAAARRRSIRQGPSATAPSSRRSGTSARSTCAADDRRPPRSARWRAIRPLDDEDDRAPSVAQDPAIGSTIFPSVASPRGLLLRRRPQPDREEHAVRLVAPELVERLGARLRVGLVRPRANAPARPGSDRASTELDAGHVRAPEPRGSSAGAGCVPGSTCHAALPGGLERRRRRVVLHHVEEVLRRVLDVAVGRDRPSAA